MTIPTAEELLDIFWDESYPGAPYGPLALEPKEVYTDHAAGISAVRNTVIEALAQDADEDFGPSLACAYFPDWLRSHLPEDK